MLTNNPKQRPIFAGFDSVLTQMASALVPMLITTILAEKYSVGEFAGENGKGLGMINLSLIHIWTPGNRPSIPRASYA